MDRSGDFGDGRSRYEEMPSAHHDHLIDLQSGRVIEFRNEDIERLQQIEELGYERVMLQHLPHDDLETVALIGERLVPAVR